MAALGALTAKGLRGWAGVPKAGDEEGMADEGGIAGFCLRKRGAGVLSMLAALQHDLHGGSFRRFVESCEAVLSWVDRDHTNNLLKWDANRVDALMD